MQTIIINTPGPQGPQGPQGSQGPTGSTIDTSSFATTGSNTFIGNQTITGSVDITGSLTVNTINVGQNTINFIDDNGNIVNSLSISSSNLVLSSGSFVVSEGGLIGTASYAETSSYSTTLGATLDNTDQANIVYLLASDGTPLNSIVVDNVAFANHAVTAQLASEISTTNIPDPNGEYFIILKTGSLVSNYPYTSSFKYSPSTNTINVTASYSLTASLAPNYVLNSATSSFVTNNQTSSFVTNSQTGSFVQNSQTSSFVTTSSFNDYTSSINNTFVSFITTGSFGGTQSITGSLIISQNLTVFGTASYVYITASQLDVGTNTISVNIFEPAQRFGGLVVYDSGSLSHQATASLLWDSEKNHWVYQNASGSTYNGGMLLSGPRNFGALGDEPSLVNNYIVKSQGGDHITTSSIYNSGSLVRINSYTEITGSLIVTNSITGSLFGTSSWTEQALTASFAPDYVLNSVTSSFVQNSSTSSFVTNAQTGSFVSENLAIAYAIALG